MATVVPSLPIWPGMLPLLLGMLPLLIFSAVFVLTGTPFLGVVPFLGMVPLITWDRYVLVLQARSLSWSGTLLDESFHHRASPLNPRG